LVFSGANPSSNPPTAPTVKNKLGAAINFGSATVINFVNGIATVSGASNGVMTLYQATPPGQPAMITATDGTLPPYAVALSVNITAPAANANKLAFVQQPSNAVAGASISPPVTVQVQDQFGNNVAAANKI